jgi:hypothetical protein
MKKRYNGAQKSPYDYQTAAGQKNACMDLKIGLLGFLYHWILLRSPSILSKWTKIAGWRRCSLQTSQFWPVWITTGSFQLHVLSFSAY